MLRTWLDKLERSLGSIGSYATSGSRARPLSECDVESHEIPYHSEIALTSAGPRHFMELPHPMR